MSLFHSSLSIKYFIWYYHNQTLTHIISLWLEYDKIFVREKGEKLTQFNPLRVFFSPLVVTFTKKWIKINRRNSYFMLATGNTTSVLTLCKSTTCTCSTDITCLTFMRLDSQVSKCMTREATLISIALSSPSFLIMLQSLIYHFHPKHVGAYHYRIIVDVVVLYIAKGMHMMQL